MFNTIRIVMVGFLTIVLLGGCFSYSDPQKDDKPDIQNNGNITSIKDLDEMLQKTKELLHSNTPDTTDQEFEKSNLNKISKKEQERSIRAHNLVAIAKDPDPEWFATKVDNPVLVVKSGENYTLHLSKQRQDGSIIGPVDNEKLRLVVRIQRDKDTFDYVTNVDIDKYVKWSGKGTLDIHVPDNLTKGRLLIGVRPNFADVATEAIAERWSTLITAEVWQTKPNVITLEKSNVIFPVDTATGFAVDSKFSKEDIAKNFDKQFTQNHTLLLPLIVKNMILKKGDFISYTFKGKPYAGKVLTIETKEKQQLILMIPQYLEIYDIVDIDENSTINTGLYPEHIVYREGQAVLTDNNESDPLKFGRSYKNQKSIFDIECSRGKSAITFEPKFVLYPFDVGIEFSTYSNSDKVECTIKANPTPITFRPSILSGGSAGLIMKIFGSTGIMSYTGQEKITATGIPGAGIKVGWSLKNGKSFKIIKSMRNLGSRDISNIYGASEGTLEMAASMGTKYELDAISPEGYLGNIFSLFGKKDVLGTIGVTVEIGPEISYAVNALNARMVYETGKSSQFAAKISLFALAEFSETVSNFFKYIGIKHFTSFNTTLDLINLKGTLDFTFSKVIDDGLGYASLYGLRTKRRLLSDLLGGDEKGVLSIDNTQSSVFNDFSESIDYDIKECQDQIQSPIIACSGWMCGKVDKPVKLCKGKLTISPVTAVARVGQTASAEATINYKAKDATIDISGSLLEPEVLSVAMTNGSTKKVKFSKECKEAGVAFGKVNVEAQGLPFKDEAKATLVCHDDESKGDPHMVTADKLGYDFFASGDYIISRIKDVDGYEIQARFLPGYKTSWPQAVALKVGDDTVEIQGIKTDGHGNGTGVPINTLAIWINGEKYYERGRSSYQSNHNIYSKIIHLPSGGLIAITNTKSSNVLTFPSSLAVIWPEGSQTENYGVVLDVAQGKDPFVAIHIARPKKFAGREEGLMGNNNGNPDDDFIRRNGQQLGKDTPMSFTALYALFGADWLVRKNESLFRNPDAIKPKFPDSVTTLTPEQRALGESACRELTGFYKEACIMDVGLTGSSDLVKEYYANTEDLNALSKKIKKPNKEDTRYSMTTSQKQFEADSGYLLHYKQDITIKKEAGEGNFVLMLRPPRGATASLSNGELSYTGSGDFNTNIEVDCTRLNDATNHEYLQSEGALQLWIQDPLSGTLDHKVSEVALSCVDESKRAVYTLELGKRDEFSDSNDTNLHYTRDVSVKHILGEKSEYIVELVPPKGALLRFANGSEDNITAVGEFNTSIELDCVNLSDINSSNKGSIKLWEIDPLFKKAGRVLAQRTLSCKKSRVLKTGQTKCYDWNTHKEEICTEKHKGQDGYYQMGEERSYSRDDINEIVTDNATGLMWQDNSEAKTMTKNWYGAKEYCQNLTLGGFDDWRLPSRKELVSLSDYGRVNPAIDPSFKNVVSNDWSSPTLAINTRYAWFVSFYFGYQYRNDKRYHLSVRCVRAGE